MSAYSMQIQAVIFDMGGVLVRTEQKSSRAALAGRFGLTYDEIDRLVFDSPTAAAATTGAVSEAAHWQTVAEQFALSPEELTAFQAAFWGGDEADSELLDFINSLRPAYRTGLLSNAWDGARKAIQNRYHLLDYFDTAVFSAEVRLAKPDPAIYRLVLNALQVEPTRAIFVDDVQVNVEAAQALGMVGIQFRNTQQVQRDILEILKM